MLLHAGKLLMIESDRSLHISLILGRSALLHMKVFRLTASWQFAVIFELM